MRNKKLKRETMRRKNPEKDLNLQPWHTRQLPAACFTSSTSVGSHTTPVGHQRSLGAATAAGV